MIPTVPPPVPVSRLRAYRWMRRVGIGAIALVVILGLGNVLGLRTTTVSASEGGTTLEVTYASVTRPGLATPWIVVVRRAGGFEDPIVISTTADYFSGFDFNQMYPEPTSTSRRGTDLVMTFDPPAGDVFRIEFDGRRTPTFQLSGTTTTTVRLDGVDGPSVTYRTWVMP